MAQAVWEKPAVSAPAKSSNRIAFVIGGIVILAAVLYLILMSTLSSAQYFITVEQLVSDVAYQGTTVRVTGAVIGDTIVYDAQNLILDFEVATIPTETEDLGMALYLAANDPTITRVRVHVEGQVMPDLLTHEAQAIMTGVLDENGVFNASELLLKCPSRFEEGMPTQEIGVGG